jgi:hypothetical protein
MLCGVISAVAEFMVRVLQLPRPLDPTMLLRLKTAVFYKESCKRGEYISPTVAASVESSMRVTSSLQWQSSWLMLLALKAACDPTSHLSGDFLLLPP